MSEEFKPLDLKATQGAAVELAGSSTHADSDEAEAVDAAPGASTAAKKKKKTSKKKKMKAAIGLGEKSAPTEDDLKKAVNNLSKEQLSEILSMNPALAQEVGHKAGSDLSVDALAKMKSLSLQDIMTGLAAGGKNAKDMASYKFWATQPVPKFGENSKIEEGPFKMIDPEKVSKEPAPLPEGFNWVTMDLTSEEELQEVFELLYGHYVEDQEAMFRFNYSTSFLRWALLSPGWKPEWHVGVRAAKSQKLVAFISGVPVSLRVRAATLSATEINFLCIHKKLRSKRLAPVLIKEITRRCYLNGIYQALYTAGVVLPTPVSTCRYFHRSLDWQKLYEVGFSGLPSGSKPNYQVAKYKLPETTNTRGLRAMEERDIDAVLDLLKRYLARFDMAPVFTREEVSHWLLHHKDTKGQNEQVVWSYVVEDPQTHKITDYISFYNLESTVIGNPKHETIKAAYLYYYASETGIATADKPIDKPALKTRLNSLVNDALILAKNYKFDVFNALSLLDNTMFLEQQKFGKGDGQLHYYLYNYNANPIAGGVDARNEVNEAGGSGIGVVML